MKPANKVYIILTGVLIGALNCFSQSSKVLPYANNDLISSRDGTPRDSLTFYFPIKCFTDSTHWYTYFNTKAKLEMSKVVCDSSSTKEQLARENNYQIERIGDSYKFTVDSLLLQWFSFELYKMNEPVIFNYQPVKEICRFTWLRSFHRPVVIKVEKDKDSIYITTKMLENNIELCVNSKKSLTGNQYERLRSVITSSNLTTAPYLENRFCHMISDGAAWIFEIANDSGYYEIYRQSPGAFNQTSRGALGLRRIGELMIELSDLKGEEVY